MKKNTWILMLVVLLMSAGLVYAEGMEDGMMGKGMKGGMMEEGMMGKEMTDGKMMGMCPMMKSMMDRSVIATTDGGIVVVSGNKLTKYDKDLNVVKEVELKMDMEGMQKMMETMKAMCPMMKSMMGGEDKATAEKTDRNDSQQSEHEGHH